MPLFRLRKNSIELLNFGLVASHEFLDLRLVLSFGFGKMVADFFNFDLVASFSLRQELTIELLDLGNSLWNEGIQPAHCSRKQIAHLRSRSLQRRWGCRFLPCG